jgi:hypothetical protein
MARGKAKYRRRCEQVDEATGQRCYRSAFRGSLCDRHGGRADTNVLTMLERLLGAMARDRLRP